jgi:hypothetical protein
MYFAIICIALISAVNGSVDPCKRLCDFDGPAICTDGSWTKSSNVCAKYVYRGDPEDLDYCYHTTATKGTCPGHGAPVLSHHVDRIIARRDDVEPLIERASSTTTTSTTVRELMAEVEERIPGEETTTTTEEDVTSTTTSLRSRIVERTRTRMTGF